MKKTKFQSPEMSAESRMHKLKNFIIISILVAGAAAMCGFLAFMQNTASKMKQAMSSEKILTEVIDTMRLNDVTYQNVETEFNTMNQTTIETLSLYMQNMDVLTPLSKVEPYSPAFNDLVAAYCKDLQALCKQLNMGVIYTMDEDGLVFLCSDPSYIGRSFKIALSEKQFQEITSYETDQDGNILSNGTMKVLSSGDKTYTPMEADDFFTYSTLLAEDHGRKYFLLASNSSHILDLELEGIKDISSVLDGITVGKTGFLFAVDKHDGKFLYFNDGTENLSGENYGKYGMNDDAVVDSYVGFQTINGVEYYCVTKEFSSALYGDYVVVAAVVAKDELLNANLTIIIISCLAFVIMSCIAVSYGMILRREIANQQIFLNKKYVENLKDEVVSGKLKYTEGEIEERAKAFLTCHIHKGTDPHFKRINIGTRNSRGVQRYFSKYVAGKMLPVVLFGLLLVYLLSFFSQTLLALQDVTVMSASRLSDVQSILKNNEHTTASIKNYVDTQYLAKARLISNMYSQIPEILFHPDKEDLNTHRHFVLDEDGTKSYVKDMYGNDVYSVGYSEFLQKTCENNNLSAIYIYDDQGRVLATNTSLWHFVLSRDPSAQSTPFFDIIDGKVTEFAQEIMADDVSGKELSYIGSIFFYYTYQGENGETIFTTADNYNQQLAGTWTQNAITKHRGLIQIQIDMDATNGLQQITSIGYVLSGMHVYSDDSFLLAFDTSDDHNVIYSPYKTSIGKKAADIGVTDMAFSTGERVYNGFQTVNGIKYYQSYAQNGDYYIATAVPTATIYTARDAISLITVGFAAIFMIIAILLYSLSSDLEDNNYIKAIYLKNNKTVTGSNFFILATPSGNKKTSSVASRFRTLKWEEKAPEQKLMTIVMIYMTIASALIGLAILNTAFATNTDSIFYYIFNGNWEKGFNVFSVTEATMVMLLIFTVTKLVQVIVQSFCGSLGARVETTGDLLVSVLRYGGILGGGFFCLHLFGLNTASLLTSAGILSLVIGLGAQSLISDILAGIFIVFEGEFRVGDIVTIGDFRGQVLEIGLRTTKVQGPSNNIKIYNNNAISGVLNMTKEASFATCTVGVEYGADLEKIEKVLNESFPQMKKNLPAIINGPIYKGVSALNESSVDLLILAGCNENDRLQLVRDLNREIFLCFKRNNINIPFPQVTLSYLNDEIPTQKVAMDNTEETTK